MTFASRLAAVASAAFLLSACGSEVADTGAPGSPTSDPPSPTPERIDVSASEQDGGDRDAAMFLTDIEVSSEDGYDRVTFAFEPREGEALVPYWRASPTEPPLREAGSGREVEVAGETFWEITIFASGVDLSGEEVREVYTGPDRITPEDTDHVAEVLKAGDFENTLTIYVGAAEGAGARVVADEDPVRIHVDFAEVQGGAGAS